MENFEKMTFGERLRYMLDLRGVSQSELARKSGITQAAISNIIRRGTRNPSSVSLQAFGQILFCSPDWLLTGKGDPVAGRSMNGELKSELIHKFERLTPPDQVTVHVVIDSMIERYTAKK